MNPSDNGKHLHHHMVHHHNCPRRRGPERGWISILFLRLIHEKPMHGYQIMEEMLKRGLFDGSRLEAGTVYTLLRRMEHHGLVTSEWQEAEAGPDRRIYRVTEDGVNQLSKSIASLAQRKNLLDELVAYYEEKLK